MGDWPQVEESNRVAISTASPEAIGVELAAMFAPSVTSTGWPSANLAIFVPFVVHRPFLVQKILMENGGSTGANADVGVYDGQQNRLVSSGSTVIAGATAAQSFDVTDITLDPGTYYMAAAVDATSHTPRGWTAVAPLLAACGVLQQASAFPLPDPATFAAFTQGYVPAITLLGRTLV